MGINLLFLKLKLAVGFYAIPLKPIMIKKDELC